MKRTAGHSNISVFNFVFSPLVLYTLGYNKRKILIIYITVNQPGNAHSGLSSLATPLQVLQLDNVTE